jgi:hypothetical protein
LSVQYGKSKQLEKSRTFFEKTNSGRIMKCPARKVEAVQMVLPEQKFDCLDQDIVLEMLNWFDSVKPVIKKQYRTSN